VPDSPRRHRDPSARSSLKAAFFTDDFLVEEQGSLSAKWPHYREEPRKIGRVDGRAQATGSDRRRASLNPRHRRSLRRQTPDSNLKEPTGRSHAPKVER
jgi:hypothetical protein